MNEVTDPLRDQEIREDETRRAHPLCTYPSTYRIPSYQLIYQVHCAEQATPVQQRMYQFSRSVTCSHRIRRLDRHSSLCLRSDYVESNYGERERERVSGVGIDALGDHEESIFSVLRVRWMFSIFKYKTVNIDDPVFLTIQE